VRHNAARLREASDPAELWAVVKANGYGHGALDVGRAALDGGATALCVATVSEGVALRERLPDARIIVLAPLPENYPAARTARLELCVSEGPLPEGVPVHVKLDTGMGRWGGARLPDVGGHDVVGVMTHFAASESDEEFTRLQLERFLTATADLGSLTRHAANSAATLALPEARLDATRCGIALYGLDPWGRDASEHGLRPALRWESHVALVKRLEPGDSTGYGRRFVAERPTWIGIVPVGYADGFRRALSGTEVVVGGERCPVIGTISMDALAVELVEPVERGTPVTLVGDGVTLDEHAAVAGTISYELATCVVSARPRTERVVTG
jgi:alanine racemase